MLLKIRIIFSQAAAGDQLYEECLTLNGCSTGDAKITSAYNLPCKKVIHTVGPIYSSRCDATEANELLISCYTRSLEICVKEGLRSVAVKIKTSIPFLIYILIFSFHAFQLAFTGTRKKKRVMLH